MFDSTIVIIYYSHAKGCITQIKAPPSGELQRMDPARERDPCHFEPPPSPTQSNMLILAWLPPPSAVRMREVVQSPDDSELALRPPPSAVRTKEVVQKLGRLWTRH